jgi:hypothetical protein
MIAAIFRKEFYKIRQPWLLVLMCHIVLLGYMGVATRRLFLLDHPEVVWYRMLHLGQIHFESLKYAPLMTGVLIACFQFLPEMRSERFRLSLHLPVSSGYMALSHLVAGLIACTMLALLDLAALAGITAVYFPREGVAITLVTALPWILAGAVAYLGGALTLLEPNLRLRIVNFGLTAGVAGLYLQNGVPGSYGPALPVLVLPLAVMMPAILLPVSRFRHRRTG